MLSRRACSGFSLVELMVAIGIFSILTALAMPSFSDVIQDAQVRAAAQSITSGLQLARAEAIRRNVSVRFELPNTLGGASVDGGTDWTIQADDGLTPAAASYTVAVDSRTGTESSKNARVGVKNANNFVTPAPAITAPTVVTFTALGRVSTPGRQIDVTNAVRVAARRLSITVSAGGQVRLCDPKLQIDTNPQGCA